MPVRGTSRSLLVGLLAGLLVLTTALPAAASDPAASRQWGLDVIGADAGFAAGGGAGVTIAIVDSGVDLDHEDLAPNLVAGRDFVDDDDRPQDGDGHGTHVAGIAAAARDNGRGIAGVAPGARIMPVRVLDDEGSGTAADVSAGIRWATANGADVINLSLGQAGQQVFGSSFTAAVREAWAAGVVVVVAAGNDFVLGSGFGDEPAIIVSATTRDDTKPDYSNGVGGARWGMAAPGGGCELLTCPLDDDIFSTYWDPQDDDVYAYLQGTSMAAPHVAGAAAVLLSLGLTPQETVDRLLATAVDIGASGRDSTFGAGRLDLAAAVQGLGDGSDGSAASTRTATPTTPPATRDPSPRPSTSDAGSPDAAPGASPSSAATTPPTAPDPTASPAPPASDGPSSATPSPSPAPTAASPDTGDTGDDADAAVAAPDARPPNESGAAARDRSAIGIVALVLLLAAGTGVTLVARGARAD